MLPVVTFPAGEELGPFRAVIDAARYMKPKDMTALEIPLVERERLLKLWYEAAL